VISTTEGNTSRTTLAYASCSWNARFFGVPLAAELVASGLTAAVLAPFDVLADVVVEPDDVHPASVSVVIAMAVMAVMAVTLAPEALRWMCSERGDSGGRGMADSPLAIRGRYD
jgi:hypothetical protein